MGVRVDLAEMHSATLGWEIKSQLNSHEADWGKGRFVLMTKARGLRQPTEEQSVWGRMRRHQTDARQSGVLLAGLWVREMVTGIAATSLGVHAPCVCVCVL